MQQFLKPAARAAETRIVTPKFFGEFLVAVDDLPSAFDLRFRRESFATLLGPLERIGGR